MLTTELRKRKILLTFICTVMDRYLNIIPHFLCYSLCASLKLQKKLLDLLNAVNLNTFRDCFNFCEIYADDVFTALLTKKNSVFLNYRHLVAATFDLTLGLSTC